ncbi:hypothetical protein SAMN05216337_103331 [Bradyrhizobium brasilense]|uniref:Uncharacterized protein n=1 Tax=Bradyrhizobium brasilense TaxID=1419277 RepID=A0A1G7F8X9_9BRAD|nr:hypothetical protein SAMN05216337_103331 [Bradyrhizobium brasilense]
MKPNAFGESSPPRGGHILQSDISRNGRFIKLCSATRSWPSTSRGVGGTRERSIECPPHRGHLHCPGPYWSRHRLLACRIRAPSADRLSGRVWSSPQSSVCRVAVVCMASRARCPAVVSDPNLTGCEPGLPRFQTPTGRDTRYLRICRFHLSAPCCRMSSAIVVHTSTTAANIVDSLDVSYELRPARSKNVRVYRSLSISAPW